MFIFFHSANAKYKYSRYLMCSLTPGSWFLVSIADWWKKPLRGFIASRLSRTGGRDVTLATRDCGISTTSQTSHVCKHRFYVIPIENILSVEAQIGLLWDVFAYLATGCVINAKYPSRYCENPAQAWFSHQFAAVFADLNLTSRGLSLLIKTFASAWEVRQRHKERQKRHKHIPIYRMRDGQWSWETMKKAIFQNIYISRSCNELSSNWEGR